MSDADTLDRLPALVIRFGRDRRIVYANRPAADHFARTPEQMVGRTLSEVGVGAGDAERNQAVLAVPVLLMSRYSAGEATAGLNGMGLAGFLRKPFRADELLRAVFDAVGSDPHP